MTKDASGPAGSLADYLDMYQGVALPAPRLEALCKEVAGLNTRVRAAAQRLTFDNDPNSYPFELVRLANARRSDNA